MWSASYGNGLASTWRRTERIALAYSCADASGTEPDERARERNGKAVTTSDSAGLTSRIGERPLSGWGRWILVRQPVGDAKVHRGN